MSKLEEKLEALADNYHIPSITEWRQGHFIDQPKYSHWSDEAKTDAEREERTRIRPHGFMNNAIFTISGTDSSRASEIVEYLEEVGRLLKEVL